MRIAFLIYCLSGGGAEQMLSRLANGMVKRGIDVDIILFDPTIIKYELDQKVAIIDASTNNKGIWRDISRVFRIRRYISKKKPDILYCFITTSLPYAIAANLFKNTKIVGAERGNPKAHTKKDRIRMRIAMPLCDGFIFQTKGARDYYNKKVKCKSSIIGNIAPRIEKPVIMQTKVAKDICTVARLSKQKDYETLFNAVARITSEIQDVKLHIYGEGDEEENLRTLAENLGIVDNVIFEGFCEDMSAEYLKYEVFVLSSKAEGMPNALMEAMASGLACVSSDCDFGPSDLIDNGKNGLLVPVGDEAALSEALLMLMQDLEKRMDMGSAAVKISEKYSEDKIIGKYVQFSNGVMGGQGYLCFRIDDVHPKMDWNRFFKFINLMIEYGIHPLLGVIPDCKDDSICKGEKHKEFWKLMRDYQSQGYPIAMHGYDHVYITKESGTLSINGYSEFAGLDGRLQEEKIKKGIEIFAKQGLKSKIFMAPAHSFDDMTIDILKKYSFQYVTDGFQKKLYTRRGMTFIPVKLNIREVEKKRSINEMITMVIHTNTMDDALLQRYSEICRKYKNFLVSYEDVMTLEPVEYDAQYEKRKSSVYRWINTLYRMKKGN